MALSASDQKLLRAVLDRGHRLERIWPADMKTKELPSELPSPEALELLGALREAVTACDSAQSVDLSRLAFHERNLTPDMTARHLSAILVPFERLLNRSLRDDEFLITDSDQTRAPRKTAPLTVIADNIRSAFNVGAILRTAECFGSEEVLLTGYTPTPEEEKTAKTSMGAEAFQPWRSVPRAQEAILNLKSRGYTIIALETGARAKSLGEFQWPEKCALLLGNERFGVDRECLALSDHVLRIPLCGQKNSLNVGIALGIALADWRKQRDLITTEASAEGSTPPTRHTLSPIGFFHSPARHPYEARRQATKDASGDLGWIELERGKGFEQALEDLDGFERIWILYRFHHNENWKPKVVPPRGPRIKRGVFATRAPYRPNPLGLSCVELVRVDGLRVFVRGFDLLDQSPVYDIKPYVPYADAFPEARIGWLTGLSENENQIEFSAFAEEQLRFLEESGVSQLRGFLIGQLENEPLDYERKRVQAAPHVDAPHVIAYRTWRASFTWNPDAKLVRVTRISSGYTTEELGIPADPYGDKDIHRAFLARFRSDHCD